VRSAATAASGPLQHVLVDEREGADDGEDDQPDGQRGDGVPFGGGEVVDLGAPGGS